MIGNDLKATRLEAGWSQRELARRAGLTHKAVQYWEAKAEVDIDAHGVRAICAAFGVDVGELVDGCARARGRVLDPVAAYEEAREELPFLPRRLLRRLMLPRVPCGARTRKGTPCRAKSEPGRRRCRFHGGLSTGPKTAVGRARIAEAQRRRWARWRAAKVGVGGATVAGD